QAYIAALPDTGFAEDDTLFIPYSRWHALVEDPDHPDTLLMWNFFGNDPFSVTHDTIGICFRAPQDWYGADSLWVVASDGSLSDTTSLVLTVIPVNDAPLPFALLEPGDDSTIVITPESIDDTLMFRWEQALDVDSDSVWYGCVVMGHLALVLPGDTSLAVDSLLLTGYQAFVDTVLAWGDSIITGTWTIFATDGMDTTWALGEGEYFTLTIKISAELLALLAADLLPTEFALHQNYPNPFNPSTTIRYDLPLATRVHIVVYDLLGREIVRLVDQRLEAGYHQLVWNGRDRTGRELPTGMYIVLMVTPEYSKSIKLVLLK
ncbi:MAG: T9SS type A sorting domain-containing protein, partial [Fidelibacterota bacterium]